MDIDIRMCMFLCYVCVRACKKIHIFTQMHMCVCVRACGRMFVFTRTHMRMCVCACVCALKINLQSVIFIAAMATPTWV